MPRDQFSKVLLPAAVRLVRPTLPGSPHPRCGTKPSYGRRVIVGVAAGCTAPLVGLTAVGWGGSQPPLPRGRKREPRGLPRSPAGTSRPHRKQRGWARARAHWLPAMAPPALFCVLCLQSEGGGNADPPQCVCVGVSPLLAPLHRCSSAQRGRLQPELLRSLPLSAGNLLRIHPQALARAPAVHARLSCVPGIKAARGP